MALILRYAVRSDLGLVRGNNEDSVYAGPRLLAIADGMGGHAAGEVASKIVISAMEPLDDDRAPGDLISALREAVLEANGQIADAVNRDSSLDGMGTTLTALRFAGSQVALIHVGDSRAYLLRTDILSQITHDDTYVQYLVDTGKLTEDEAKDHPRKSVILRALRGADVETDVSIRESRAGDRYLLCSDGLSDVVSTQTIYETLRIPDVQECADRLVELALRSGGPDNVTVIVADVVSARLGDVIDETPVMDGAFVDPSAADVPGADSAAERAAAISRPRTAATRAPVPAPRRRNWKTPVIIAGVLVLIGAALFGTYAWAQTQYYVGRSGAEVAIYKGVDTAFGPLKFSEVYQNTDLQLSDLNASWRAQVRSGITAKSLSDARTIVKRLHGELHPICGTTMITPSPTPPRSSPRTPPTSATAGTKTTAKPTAKTTAKPSSRVITKPSSKTSPTPAASRSMSTAPVSTPSPYLSIQTSTPNNPCRQSS